MMTEKNIVIDYDLLNNELIQQQIGMTASELHGLISGIICGGNHDDSWLPLLYDFANDGHTFSNILTNYVRQIYQTTKAALDEENFSFQLLIPADNSDIFNRIDELAGWVNHFLLGLGLTQPKLDKVKGEVGEVVTDLRSIALLGYDEDEDQNELEHALEEVQEYVRMAAILCFSEFTPKASLSS